MNSEPEMEKELIGFSCDGIREVLVNNKTGMVRLIFGLQNPVLYVDIPASDLKMTIPFLEEAVEAERIGLDFSLLLPGSGTHH
jgi:hypothetical protein